MKTILYGSIMGITLVIALISLLVSFSSSNSEMMPTPTITVTTTKTSKATATPKPRPTVTKTRTVTVNRYPMCPPGMFNGTDYETSQRLEKAGGCIWHP